MFSNVQKINVQKITPVVLLGLFSASAFAGNSIEDTHYFRLGAYDQEAEIKAVSSLEPLPPIEIDLSKDLGLDDTSTTPFFNYRWRFGEKWSMNIVLQRLELDSTGTASKDFNFDGVDFTVGGTVRTEFNVDTYLIDFNYSFVRNDKWEVSAGAGIHAFDLETVIEGQVGIGSGSEEALTDVTRVNVDVLAPLPNLRGAVTYMITPKWEVKGTVGWLSLKIDDFDGSYVYTDIATEYRFTDRFAVGASYQIATIDVTVTESDGFDKLDVDFSGPSIYLAYGF